MLPLFWLYQTHIHVYPCWPWDDSSSPSALILFFISLKHRSPVSHTPPFVLFLFPFWYTCLSFLLPIPSRHISLPLSSLSHLSVQHTTFFSVRWGRSGPRSEPWCRWRTRDWRTKMEGWMEKRRKERKWKVRASVPVRISPLPGISGIWLARAWCIFSACCFCLGPIPGANWHSILSCTSHIRTLIHSPWLAHTVTLNSQHPFNPHCTSSVLATGTTARLVFIKNKL